MGVGFKRCVSKHTVVLRFLESQTLLVFSFPSVPDLGSVFFFSRRLHGPSATALGDVVANISEPFSVPSLGSRERTPSCQQHSL